MRATLIAVMAFALLGTSSVSAASAPSGSPPPGGLSFKGGEVGTKTTTVPVSPTQCRAMMTARNVTGADTACIETMTAGSSAVSAPAAPSGLVAASSSSGWHYAYHYTELCWGIPGNACYFLTIKDEATFQYNYSTVWVAAGTGVSCSHPNAVWPYSASTYWCGGWNNGGAPVYGNNWGHWMNVGDNSTVCFGSGVQACADHWQRLAIDVWGNWWANGG